MSPPPDPRTQREASLKGAWNSLPEAAALHIQSLQRQVERSHEVIAALVDRCMVEQEARGAAERDALEARRMLAKLKAL